MYVQCRPSVYRVTLLGLLETLQMQIKINLNNRRHCNISRKIWSFDFRLIKINNITVVQQIPLSFP